MSLFDDHGRRIPYGDMRVHSQVSRQYFCLNQPEVDYTAIWRRTVDHLQLTDPPVAAQRFCEVGEAIVDGLRRQSTLANLVSGVHVPFLSPPAVDLRQLLRAVGRSYTTRFPEADFLDLCPGKPNGNALLAPGSRYEKFEEARTRGYVVGLYFPNCLAEFDVDSQRRQMATLPETLETAAGTATIILSGPVDAAAALIGSPDLLWNEASYPHHLCLSAIQDPEDKIVYTFEAYGHNLRFRYRSNMLTPSVTQVSEQWAGGLTVFMSPE